MSLKILDFATDAGGAANEDRGGALETLAWMIDGATGVADTPLLPGPSDAAWLADAYHRHVARLGSEPYPSLPALLETAILTVAADFEAQKLRPIEKMYEVPSAAGLFAEIRDGGLNMMTLADCCLFVEPEPGAPVSLYGPLPQHIGDPGIAALIRDMRAEDPGMPLAEINRRLRPRLRATREHMNSATNYNVLSLDTRPLQRIGLERIEIRPKARLLLATDGFTRPWDIFGHYSMEGLYAAAVDRGLGEIIRELRVNEQADPEGFTAPRLKVSDDATAILLEYDPD